ncbi:MAG TPA: HIT family protein [Ktedonobacteraceae bacterium]|jgi:histidine triad (HIT) family protein|nr:HIT family protein [Ktedonobacteraceae bacterium]
MGCIFCEIIAGRVATSMVWQDEHTCAFMSLEQPNPYKVLVVPCEHVETLYDLNDEQAAQVFQTTVRVARAIREVAACPGLNLVQSNGHAGQQDIFHFHIHLIPRFSDDKQAGRVTLTWDNTSSERQELDHLAADLRASASLR